MLDRDNGIHVVSARDDNVICLLQKRLGRRSLYVLFRKQTLMAWQAVSHVKHCPGMTLADGSRWGIAPIDAFSSCVASRLTDIMKLKPQSTPSEGQIRLMDAPRVKPKTWLFNGEESACCVPGPCGEREALAVVITQIQSIIGRYARSGRALFLHGALAERNECGVLLAGPGGAGKTTASSRLLLPWRSLSDDVALTVRDRPGRYWAHPWPTSGKVMGGCREEAWDIHHAVPLKGIFFLYQAKYDRAEPMGAGEAVGMLLESAKQASITRTDGLERDRVRSLHVRLFDNVCELAKGVSCFRLYLSLEGAFWEEIERVLE